MATGIEQPATAELRAEKKARNTEVIYDRGPIGDRSRVIGLDESKSITNRKRMKRPWAREALLAALAAETLDDKGRKTRKLRMIIDRLINAAIDGQPWAIQEVMNRVDGKPAQLHSNDPDNPLPGTYANFNEVRVMFVDKDGQPVDPPEMKDITPGS